MRALARLVLFALGLAGAGCFGPEHLEPADGGRDFAFQGEYEGAGHGAQVVARGSGRFEAALHAGGLPGAGASGETPLTARELEIASVVARGKSNKAAAKELAISARTVSTHLSNIYQKLGVGSRMELAEYLRQNGLLG